MDWGVGQNRRKYSTENYYFSKSFNQNFFYDYTENYYFSKVFTLNFFIDYTENYYFSKNFNQNIFYDFFSFFLYSVTKLVDIYEQKIFLNKDSISGYCY